MNSAKNYINLGLVDVECETLVAMFHSTTKATNQLIELSFNAAQQFPVNPVSIGFDEKFTIADFSILQQLLQIKRASLERRLIRSQVFIKEKTPSGFVWSLDYSKVNLGAKPTTDPKEKRKATMAAIKTIEDKHRRHPPLKECVDNQLMVNLPFGDPSSLSVPSNAIVHSRRFLVNVGGQKAIVLASGGNGIIDKEDTKTLYALISQTIHYHTLYNDSLSRDGEISNNLTPIYADTILDIIGRRKGVVANRKYLWRQIVKIRTTEYDVHSLEPILNGKEPALFANKQFRYIVDTPSLSENALDLASGDDASPSIYEIVWHPVIFKAIFRNKFLFSFPESIFREPTQMFSLYLDLRNRMRYATPSSIKITKSELMSITLEDGCEYDFQSGFFHAFTKTASSELKEELSKARKSAKRTNPIEVERDFFGFKIKLLVTGRMVFSILLISFDLEEVLRHCGVKMNTRGGNSSPSLPNKLYSTGMALESLESIDEHENNYDESFINENLTTMQLWRRTQKVLDTINGTIERTPYALRVKVESIHVDFIVTNATLDKTIKDNMDALMQKFSVNPSYVNQYLISARDSLRALSFQRKQITNDDIIELRRELNNQGRNLSIEKVVYYLATNNLLREMVVNNGVNQETIDVISQVIPVQP